MIHLPETDFHSIICKTLVSFWLSVALSLCLYSNVNAQNNNWYFYQDKKTHLLGYKDAQGKIKIPAKFDNLTRSAVFRNIIAVTDAKTNSSYYLLRSGKKVGIDSLYIFDFAFDCEQEGKIRFRDPKTDLTGFLDKDGSVKIAANFNDCQPFYNGFALVNHGGKRICWDGTAYDPTNPCEHWGWDGITALIDTTGQIIADSLDLNQISNLNWYSSRNSTKPSTTPGRTSLKTKMGGYLSFINYRHEFDNWFYKQYVNGSQLEKCYTSVSVDISGQSERKFYSKASFLKRYRAVLARKMNAIKNKDIENIVSSDDLNTITYNGPEYRSFITDCGESNTSRYPVFDVITNHYRNSRQLDYQEHFVFIRTAAGYQLIGMTLKM